MMRNEVVGQVASLSSIEPFVNAGSGTVVFGVGGSVAPQAEDFAETEEANTIIDLIEALSEVGRLTAGPAGMPADVLAELREGYLAALADPDLLADAERLGIPIDPMSGDEVAALVQAALNQSPATIAIIARAVDVQVDTIVVTSELLEVGEEGREIRFMSGDADITAAPSGSRTAVTINGAEATRADLASGMTCTIEYNPGAEGNEPLRIACDG